jgi:hypothetical protein
MLRINAARISVAMTLQPLLAGFLKAYPDVLPQPAAAAVQAEGIRGLCAGALWQALSCSKGRRASASRSSGRKVRHVGVGM